jgi:hypothetical protein
MTPASECHIFLKKRNHATMNFYKKTWRKSFEKLSNFMKLNQLVSIFVIIVTIHMVGVVPARANVVLNPVTMDSLLTDRDHQLHAVTQTGDAVVSPDNTTMDTAGQHDASMTMWTASDMSPSRITHADGQSLHTVFTNPNPNYSYTTDSGFNIPADASEMISLFFNTIGNRPYDDIQDDAKDDNSLNDTGHFQNVQPLFDIHVEWTPNTRYQSNQTTGGNNPSFSNTVSNQYISTTSTQYQNMDWNMASSSRECCRSNDVFLSIGFIRLNRWEFFGIVLMILWGFWSAKS